MFFNELFKETMPTYKIKNNIGEIIIFLLLVVYIFIVVIKSKNKIKTLLIILLIFVIIIVVMMFKFNTNRNLGYPVLLSDIANELNTGDIVMFRGFENDSFCFRIITNLLQQTYFSHIGLVYKTEDGEINIIENHPDYFYCKLTNKIKNGAVMLNLQERVSTIKNTRIHIIKTNIHEYLDLNKFKESIIKYSSFKFGFGFNANEEIYCVNYVSKILEENGLFKSNKLIYLFPNDLLNKYNYTFKINFEEAMLVKDF